MTDNTNIKTGSRPARLQAIPGRDPEGLTARRVLAATSVSYVIVLLDTSIVNVALNDIATSLATHIEGLQWVMNAYTLAFASLLLSGGKLGDRRGARNIYLAGLALFTLASVACGMAPDLPTLVMARVLQGAGAAMLVPCSLKLINQACPDPHQRARAVGIWVACGGIAMAAGPLVGGILIQLFDWRSIFFVNVPVGLLGIGMTLRIPGDATALPAQRFDLAGQLSAIIALGGLIAVLIEGRALGWGSPVIVAGIALTVIAWVVFLVAELRHREPMLPLALFNNGIFAGSTCVSMASAFVFYGLFFVTSLDWQQAKGYSPLAAGLAFLPMTIMVALGSLISNRLVKCGGRRGSMCAAFGLYAAGALGLLAAAGISSYWLAVAPMLAIGLASGFISPAATAPAMSTVGKESAGVAAAVLNAARQTGAALGVAIFGTLITAFQPLVAGMRIVLCLAVAVSMLAAAAWWLATAWAGD